MIEIKMKDNSNETLRIITSRGERALEAVGLQAERNAKKICPVRTGRLRNSISHSQGAGVAYIGTNVEYAPYVELGTSRQKAKPFLRPAAENHVAEYKAIFKRYLQGS